MEQHQAAMTIADVVLFLRRNGQVFRANLLSEYAFRAGVNPAPIAAAWLERI